MRKLSFYALEVLHQPGGGRLIRIDDDKREKVESSSVRIQGSQQQRMNCNDEQNSRMAGLTCLSLSRSLSPSCFSLTHTLSLCL